MTLPRLLRPFLHIPGLRNFTVVARPTFSPSGGFPRSSECPPSPSPPSSSGSERGGSERGSSDPGSSDPGSGSSSSASTAEREGYRGSVPKHVRRRSSLLVVVDMPGLTQGGANPDPKYEW